ncbi:MAG: sporulation integral membrane protein YtvI [Oscillospiraceae bacterium]
MKTEARRKFIINTLYWGLTLALVYAGFRYLAPLVMPFLVAFLFAVMLKPVIKFMCGKLKLNKKLAAVLAVILLFGVVGVIIALLGAQLFSYLGSVFTSLPRFYTETIAPVLYTAYEELRDVFGRISPQMLDAYQNGVDNMITSLGNTVTNISVKAVGVVSSYASSLPKTLVSLLVTIIATFFVTVDYDRITEFIMSQLGDRRRELVLEVKREGFDTIGRFARSYIVIMLMTFCEMLLGYWILGVSNIVLLAAVTAVFDILPIVGTGTIIIPWGILALVTGDYVRGSGLLILYIVVTVIRQIMEPKIVGSHVGLHPIATLMSMYVGTHLFGILGLFGLPISLSVLNTLNRRGTIKLFNRKE